MKIAVIYASTTGNTEAMANAVSDAAKAAGAVLAAEPFMVNLTPADSDLEKCKEWTATAIK